MQLKSAKIAESDYENLVVLCPHCHVQLIYNRATDLLSFDLIDHRTVKCFKCSNSFHICGDCINPAYEMLIYGCHELMLSKKYMQVALILAQSCEIFALTYLRSELIYKPLLLDDSPNEDRANELDQLLMKKIEKWTFQPLRAVVLWHLVNYEDAHRSLKEAKEVLEHFPSKPKSPNKRILQSFKDDKLRKFALAWNNITIGGLRNNVVHKNAYRPSQIEVSSELSEIRLILLPAKRLLGIVDWLGNPIDHTNYGVSRARKKNRNHVDL